MIEILPAEVYTLTLMLLLAGMTGWFVYLTHNKPDRTWAPGEISGFPEEVRGRLRTVRYESEQLQKSHGALEKRVHTLEADSATVKVCKLCDRLTALELELAERKLAESRKQTEQVSS